MSRVPIGKIREFCRASARTQNDRQSLRSHLNADPPNLAQRGVATNAAAVRWHPDRRTPPRAPGAVVPIRYGDQPKYLPNQK